MILSILSNTESGMTTYYVGENYDHVKHLKDCKLLCKQSFDGLDNVEQIIVDNPQLEFYKLSHQVKDEYTFYKDNYKFGKNCDIHSSVVIGDGVDIGNNVSIGPNTTIYSKTKIEDGVRIGSNCTIGAEGMMWVWDGNEKVFLRQLGGVIIEKNSIIGSNSVIVRGSANENTEIKESVNLAPGCCIGHGTIIGKYTHLANNLSIGGSCNLGEYNFYGSGAVVNPGVKVKLTDILLGAGSTLTKSVKESGVYYGVPAKKIKNVGGKHSGVPTWRK